MLNVLLRKIDILAIQSVLRRLDRLESLTILLSIDLNKRGESRITLLFLLKLTDGIVRLVLNQNLVK
jgi:hypothetical protein